MAIKRKGIVARPGVHMNVRTGLDEVITWDALKHSVQFQNRIPLVVNHPQSGYFNPKDRIGTVTQTINEKEKVIEGEFWFFDEPDCWGQIPVDLKKKIINGREILLSAGYKLGGIVNGEQRMRHYDHIALGIQNPLHQDVGITEGDVRMESKLPENFRIEETPTIAGEKKEEPVKVVPPTEPHNASELWIMIGEMKAEIKALREATTKPAVEETAVETRPEPAPIPEQAPPKPKTVVPQGAASKEEALDDDGLFRITG